MFQESLEQSLLEWHLKFCTQVPEWVDHPTFSLNPSLCTNNILMEKSLSLGFTQDLGFKTRKEQPNQPVWVHISV
jgi:hypothetical protein